MTRRWTRTPKWTPERDARMTEMRLGGASWQDIDAALGIHWGGAKRRGETLGVSLRKARSAAVAQRLAAEREMFSDARTCMPPGHPRSWGAITNGTILDGTPYPKWTTCR